MTKERHTPDGLTISNKTMVTHGKPRAMRFISMYPTDLEPVPEETIQEILGAITPISAKRRRRKSFKSA